MARLAAIEDRDALRLEDGVASTQADVVTARVERLHDRQATFVRRDRIGYRLARLVQGHGLDAEAVPWLQRDRGHDGSAVRPGRTGGTWLHDTERTPVVEHGQ